MTFRQANDPQEGTRQLAEEIISRLNTGKKVLWLVSGGSNIPISVEIMKMIREQVSSGHLANLSVALTDERFGSIGHADSNWKQLENANFDFSNIKAIPVLKDLPSKKTVLNYSKSIQSAIDEADFTIAQFGIGTDGHIAGILPDSTAARSQETVYCYEAPPYTRITLTFPILKKLHVAYTFVFGDSKCEAIKRLRNGTETLEKLPALVLNEISKAIIYTDQ